MSVFPGFGGQKFIPEVLDKVKNLRQQIDEKNLEVRLEIDGGVNSENISDISSAGADTFVAGSAIFNNKITLMQLRISGIIFINLFAINLFASEINCSEGFSL